jgi:hypothetical protein
MAAETASTISFRISLPSVVYWQQFIGHRFAYLRLAVTEIDVYQNLTFG